MKAIETIYKGYKFRSRLEARWAVFFDAVGVEWDYETEGYEFSDGTRYLPDFYIREKRKEDASGWFVEVKGNLEDEVGVRKARKLDSTPPDNVMGCIIISGLRYAEKKEVGYNEPPEYNGAALFSQRLGVEMKDFNRAITKGKQARFEYGETPCV